MFNVTIQPRKFLTGICLLGILLSTVNLSAQTINWGPAIPSVVANDLQSCYGESDLIFEFTNGGTALTNATIEVELGTGVKYIAGTLSATTSGSSTVTEGILTDLTYPEFVIGNLAVGEIVTVTISRAADCDARSFKIGGGSFEDIIHVLESGTQVNYSGGDGIGDYDLTYASLSVTNVLTTPSTNNLGGTSIRTVDITNGSFGIVDEFYYADVFPAGEIILSNFVMNPGGVATAIPAANITTIGDSVIIHFDAALIASIDGSEGFGDGDNLFELDEQFVLEYDVTTTTCGATNTISSDLYTWWGCSYDVRCQVGNSAASIGLNNATPTLAFSNASSPRLELCDTVEYKVRITNTSAATVPTGGAFAKDVAVMLGLRSNNSPISTPDNVTMWSTDRRGTRNFTNFKINGFAVTLPTIAGLYGDPVDYIAYDYFTTDPDGPGGLEDIDGDGFYDDLAEGEFIDVSYGAFMTLRSTTCSTGRYDFLTWEHISADVSWDNQCDVLMSPIRKEFNYTNLIRDYLNPTLVNHPTDVLDADTFNIEMKPHMYNTVNCGGASGTTGPGVDFSVEIVLPPGVKLSPNATTAANHAGYNPSLTQVGDTVFYSLNRYTYDWFNFELVFDCNEWDGANPVSIPFKSTYTCTVDGSVCYFNEMHCKTVNFVPHCPGGCVGVTPIDFTTDRVSESWTDNTQTALVDLDPTEHELNIVYPFDTVNFSAIGIFNDTMSENLYMRVTYAPQNGGNIFDYVSGDITIKDVDGAYNGGQVVYNTPLTTAPVVNNLGGSNYEMIFDLSSYRTIVDPNYKYGESPPTYSIDTVEVNANVTILNTFTGSTMWDVNNLRASFFILDEDGNEVSCNNWGSQLKYQMPYYTTGTGIRTSSGCGIASLPLYFTHRTSTGDDFPNEYRPDAHVDSIVVNIPTGYSIGDVTFYDGTILGGSNVEIRPDGKLVVRRPSGYADWDKIGTHYPRIYVEFIPSCQSFEGKSFVPYTVHYKRWTYLTNTADHEQQTHTSNSSYITYTKPTFTLTPLNQTRLGISDTVSWDVRVCNSTSDMDTDYNWLLLQPTNTSIDVLQVYDVTTGSEVPLLRGAYPGGGDFVKLEDINATECMDVRIYARYNNCNTDTLQISHGWTCDAYPDPIDMFACEAYTETYLVPQTAQISATITSLSLTPADPSDPTAGNFGSSEISMCEEFPVEYHIVSAQPGTIYDLDFSLFIPNSGNGLEYVPGSATVEVEGIDAAGVPRPFGAVAETALINFDAANAFSWFLKLEDIDPTNFGNDEGLTGTVDVSQNEVTFRFLFKSTCSLTSGRKLRAVTYGDQPCGGSALGSGEVIYSSPLDLIGAASPYSTSVNSFLSTDNKFETCDATRTLETSLTVTGGTTSATDTIYITLPTGLGYDGGFACSTGSCPTLLGSNLVNGVEIVSLVYSLGFSGTTTFEMELAVDDVKTCEASNIINVTSSAVIGGLSCDGTPCSSTNVVTGQSYVNAKVEKPNLSVTFTDIRYTPVTTPNSFEYEIKVDNVGTATTEDVVIDIYCLNTAKTDIIGSPVHTITITNSIPNNGSEILTGVFGANCSVTDGVAALITPGVATCYCNSIDNMAAKGPGLDEIPHAKATSVVLPIELKSFEVNALDCAMEIKWVTETETDNKYFELQRSDDGYKFEVIETIQGGGTTYTETAYQSVDKFWKGVGKSYYRLKQIDIDGSYSFSSVVAAEWKNCSEEQANPMYIYPNPMGVGQNVLTVNFHTESISAKIIITDVYGRTIKALTLENELGWNTLRWDISDIPSGTYNIVKEADSGKKEALRFIITK